MSEEDAFWTLVALLKVCHSCCDAPLAAILSAEAFTIRCPPTRMSQGAKHRPMEGLYSMGLPLLQHYMQIMQQLLSSQAPRLASHLEAEGVLPSMYCSQWFITVFAYNLPFDQLLRCWDIFLLEGMTVSCS